jgi:hypothetical protein
LPSAILEGGTLQNLNEPFGFYLVPLTSFRKHAFFGASFL